MLSLTFLGRLQHVITAGVLCTPFYYYHYLLTASKAGVAVELILLRSDLLTLLGNPGLISRI